MFGGNTILLSFPGGRVIVAENRIPLFRIMLQLEPAHAHGQTPFRSGFIS
jgi:hypothetical protein